MIDNRKYYYYLATIITATAAVYSIIIYIMPYFYMDDFEIFAEVSKTNSPLFYTNPINHFYLSLRPVSYLMFKLDYFMWGTNAIGMKINGLFLHIILIVIYFKILILISRFLKIEIDLKAITVFALIFSLNPESSIWIFIINNQTELLGTLFYALAIFCFLRYLFYPEAKPTNLISYLIFYSISIFSKQQTLHLPLLIIFLLFVFKKKFEKKIFNNAVLFSCLSATLMVFISVLNISFIYYKLTPTDVLKKPFSALGILIYSVFPVFTEYIYYYILYHKTAAVIPIIILVVIGSYIFIKKKSKWKNIFLFMIGFIIILYPRIYSGYTERINSIIILWIIILLFVLYRRIILNKYKKIALMIYCLIIIAGLILNLVNYNNSREVLEKQRQSLASFLNYNPRINNALIACSHMQYLNPYEIFYINNKSFGADQRLTPLPVTCSLISSIYYSSDVKVPSVNVSMDDEKLVINVLSPKYILRPDPLNRLFSNFSITPSLKNERSFSRIEIDMSKNNELNESDIIYYNGLNWETVIKQEHKNNVQ
jgi:hypothetical protein